jgi:hypothetical protein
MIISVTLFVGALLLLFIYINPIQNKESKISVIENTQKIFIKNISSDVGALSVILKNNSHCYNQTGLNLGVNYLEIEENPRVYTIYFSDYVNNDHPHYNPACPAENYSLGIYSEESMIIMSKVIDLKNNYDSNYKELKKSWGITNDFSFNFKYLNGSLANELTVEKETPTKLERQSDDIPVRVIDERGVIIEMILNLRIW